MRRVVIYFLIAEILDFITTYIGISMGGIELNPLFPLLGWTWLIIFKLLSILIIVVVMQKKTETKFDILVPISITLFVVWNTINIVLA